MFRRGRTTRGTPPAEEQGATVRYGPEARRVVVASAAQAQADGSDAVGPHHLLLAATSAPTSMAWTLATKGLHEAALRDALALRSGVPLPATDVRGRARPGAAAPTVPFPEETKAVLAAAARVAHRQGRATVAAGDLVTAVLEAGAPTVDAALDELGLDPATLVAALT